MSSCSAAEHDNTEYAKKNNLNTKKYKNRDNQFIKEPVNDEIELLPKLEDINETVVHSLDAIKEFEEYSEGIINQYEYLFSDK